MSAILLIPALFLAAAFLAFPFALKALTAAELSAEVQSLLSDIALLQAQLKNLTPAPATTAVPRAPLPIAPVSPAWCPLALPPAIVCGPGWQPVTDQYGCTSYYQCVIPLPRLTSSPTVSFKYTTDRDEAPLRAKFTLGATDSTLKSGIQYTTDFGDGYEKKFPRKKKPSLTHRYNEQGEYEVVVTRHTKCAASKCSGESTEVASTTVSVE